jgi:hypothetical protein
MTLMSGIVAIKPLTEGKRRPICVHTIMIPILMINFTKNSMFTPLTQVRNTRCFPYIQSLFDVCYESGSLNAAFGFIIGSRAHAVQ